MKKRCGYFTLTELLTVITIFCVIIGILMPVFSGSVNRAKLAFCGGNLRNIGQIVQYYCYDNAGMLPNIFPGMEQNSIPIIRLPNNITLALGRLMNNYVSSAYIFGCPDSPGHQGNDIEQLWQSSAMVWTAYLYRGQSSNYAPRLNSPENFNRPYLMDFACITNQGEEFAPHNFEASNLLFADGHTESRKNSKKTFEYFTAQAARHGEITPDCTILWQHADLP